MNHWIRRFRRLWLVLAVVLACSFADLHSSNITYRYDDAGRLSRIELPQGKAIEYQYDRFGNFLGRCVTVPCFNWEAYMLHVSQWPENGVTVLTLIQDRQCP